MLRTMAMRSKSIQMLAKPKSGHGIYTFWVRKKSAKLLTIINSYRAYQLMAGIHPERNGSDREWETYCVCDSNSQAY
jgi:hypothetical protein